MCVRVGVRGPGALSRSSGSCCSAGRRGRRRPRLRLGACLVPGGVELLSSMAHQEYQFTVIHTDYRCTVYNVHTDVQCTLFCGIDSDSGHCTARSLARFRTSWPVFRALHIVQFVQKSSDILVKI